MAAVRTLFNCNVWGESHIRRFTELALPCQLADGNLGGLAGLADDLYLIGTTEADRPLIAAAPSVKALSRLMRVDYLTDVDPEFHKHRILNQFQRLAMMRAVAGDFRAVVPLYGDQLYSTGSLANALDRIARGSLAVFAQGPRGREDGIARHVRARAAQGSGIAAFSGRDLVRLLLDNLHPFERSFFADAPCFSAFPSHVQWRADDAGVVVHSFHLHPVALRVLGERPAFTGGIRETLDGGYLDDLFRPGDPLHVVEDSDSAFNCSVEDRDDFGAGLIGKKPFDMTELAMFAMLHAGRLGRNFWPVASLYKTADATGAAWDDARGAASATVEALMAVMAELDRQNAKAST